MYLSTRQSRQSANSFALQVMTANEIRLISKIFRNHFGEEAAVVGQILLENGEMRSKDVHRCNILLGAGNRISRKKVERVLHCFFQYGLLNTTVYDSSKQDSHISYLSAYDSSPNDPFISLNIYRCLLLLCEPLLCHAVQEVIGEEAAHLVALILAHGTISAVDLLVEVEKDGQITKKEAENLLTSEYFVSVIFLQKFPIL